MCEFFPVSKSRRELRAELDSLRAEFGDADDSLYCLFSKDRGGRLTWVNDTYCRFVSRSADDIIGRTDFDLFPAVFAQKYRDDDLHVMAEGRAFRTFESIRGPDGSHRHIYVVKVPDREAWGEVVGTLGAFRVSPARSEVEARLHQSEERLRGIIDRMPVMLSALDRQGRIVYWNRECERVTGFTAAEIVGNPEALSLLYPDAEYLKGMMDQWDRGQGPPRNWEWTLTCKDGTQRTVAWSNIGDGPLPLGWSSWSLGVDITEKKSALNLLEAIRDLQAGHINRRSPADLFARLLKHLLAESRSEYGFIGEVLQKSSGELYLNIHACTKVASNEKTDVFIDVDNQQVLINQIIASGGPLIVNDCSASEFLRGYPRLHAFLGVPIYHNGRLVGIAGLANRLGGYGEVVTAGIEPLLVTCATLIHSNRIERERERDEADRRRLETQLQQAQKLESLGVLAGGIAHDFNNLLVSILGHASLAIEDMPQSTPVRDSLRQIETAARRAADLCKQLLAYSGKGRFVVRRVNLSELVCEMAHLLQVSISKKASLRYQLVPDVPTIEADATQIRQVVMNLITNAAEACGEHGGEIKIATGLVLANRDYLATAFLDWTLPEGRYIFLEVADSGCGMDEATRERLFDPFFTTKMTGRGLGMAAVLGIVRGHRGAIRCDSAPGRGTTFRLLFPAAEGPPDPPSQATSPPVVRRTATVLIVDDEEVVRTFAQQVLERHGFKVYTANNGRMGLDLFRRHIRDIDLVLLDMTMPILGGDEVFGELRRLRPDVKVIFSSGYNKQDSVARDAGPTAAGFIQKPYRPTELIALIGVVLADMPARTGVSCLTSGG
jgi:PAS domain S-box-containing protein